ncbi:short chain dehydrogenase domain-containing protein [Sarocladium implicatum]|nr:short chain dehydrogenase domain-containing protein [Sarocladium implicatum]
MSVFTPDSTALITGAASGIGLALAKHCFRSGMNVILVDLNSDALKTAESALKDDSSASAKGSTLTVSMDVTSLSDWESLKKTVADKYKTVELLVLNAAIGIQGRSWGDDEYFRKTLETNIFGVINGVNAFLPVIKDASSAKQTSIVITGSKQGITNPPGNPAYNASKAAVKSLAEGLDWELRNASTSVHLLVPGWTYTGMTKAPGSTEKPAGAWWPEQVVEYLVKKMEAGKFYAICPDNDVSEETDKKRMLYAAGDITQERPALSRWREDWKDKANDIINNTQI